MTEGGSRVYCVHIGLLSNQILHPYRMQLLTRLVWRPQTATFCGVHILMTGMLLFSSLHPLCCDHSGGGSEKGGGLAAVKNSPRGRMHALTRSPLAVRRTPPRELVSFGRHKLRRLSPTYSRTSKEGTHHSTKSDFFYLFTIFLFSASRE